MPCNHQYDVDKYQRDDMGFYNKCTICGEDTFFEADTLEDYYDIFGYYDSEDEDDQVYNYDPEEDYEEDI